MVQIATKRNANLSTFGALCTTTATSVYRWHHSIEHADLRFGKQAISSLKFSRKLKSIAFHIHCKP
jgi:hypothetical protein